MLITQDGWTVQSGNYSLEERIEVHKAVFAEAPRWKPRGWYVDEGKLSAELREKLERDFPQEKARAAS